MNNKEVAHLWAAQSRASARGSHFHFQGASLYSYATEIARIYPHLPRSGRGPIVVMAERQYSMTTAKHKNYARQAVTHMHLCEVPQPFAKLGPEHGANVDYLLDRAARELKSAQRAGSGTGVAWRRHNAEHYLAQARTYATYFGVRRKIEFPEMAWNLAASRAERLENPDPASRDKRERASAQRRAAKAAKEARANERKNLILDPCARTDWRLFGAFNVREYNRSPGAVMLRVNGEEIETSMGARVPLAAAPMVWNLVERTRAELQSVNGLAKTWANGLRRIHIGDYPLDRIDADGTLHAGCHVIPYSELAAMARALNL